MTRATRRKSADLASDSKIDVVVDDAKWAQALDEIGSLAEACYANAAALEPGVRGEIALLLADDSALRALNLRFRGRDAPTNVLSFRADREKSGFLGDIAIAFETCERESRDQGVAFRDHVAHLIVHGLLHLAGHDHDRDDEAERMERLESRILSTMGIADPYKD